MAAFVPTRPGAPDAEPFATINTTPLIDVMLVLLIMFVITIPAALNKLPVNLPQPGRAKAAVTHELTLTRGGSVTLDGVALAEPALGARLRTIALTGDNLSVRTDPDARYDRFVDTLGSVKRAGITRLGFAHGKAAAF